MPQIRVATFNTHWSGLRPKLGGLKQSNQRYDVLTACRALDADVLVLEEIWQPDDGTTFLEDLQRDGYEVLFNFFGRGSITADTPRLHGSDSNGNWGIAVLSRLPVTFQEKHDLGHSPGDPFPTRSTLEVRVQVGDREFVVFGLHANRYRLPLGPVIHLRRLAKYLPASGTAAAVMGDCNLWGPLAVSCLPGWSRAVRGRTWPAHLPHSQIDHILVREPDVRVIDAKVFEDVGSDHRPIRAVLEF